MNKLIEIFLLDLKKPSINKHERATIIKSYLDTKKLSIRQFALKFGFKKSTIEDWLLPARLTEEEYFNLVGQYGETGIYKLLRENKDKSILELTELDVQIDKLIYLLSSTEKIKYHSKYTKDKIEQLKKAINTALFRLEKTN